MNDDVAASKLALAVSSVPFKLKSLRAPRHDGAALGNMPL